MRTILKLLISGAATLTCLLGIVGPAFAGTTPLGTTQIMETTDSRKACHNPFIENPFTRFGDNLDYVLAPDGNFDGTVTGWQVAGGAQIVETDKGRSLQLPKGSSAISPSMCLDLNFPTFRMYDKVVKPKTGLLGGVLGLVLGTPKSARLKVEVVYHEISRPVWTEMGHIDGDKGPAAGNGWRLSESIDLKPELGGPQPGARQAALRFTVVEAAKGESFLARRRLRRPDAPVVPPTSPERGTQHPANPDAPSPPGGAFAFLGADPGIRRESAFERRDTWTFDRVGGTRTRAYLGIAPSIPPGRKAPHHAKAHSALFHVCPGLDRFRDDGLCRGSDLGSTQIIETADSRKACVDPVIENPFTQFGDYADYVLAPDGNFDGNVTGWQLPDGAQIVDTDKGRSLQIPEDGIAISPSMCLDLHFPTFRMYHRTVKRRAAGGRQGGQVGDQG